MIFHVVKQIPVKYPIDFIYRYTFSAGTTFSHGINIYSVYFREMPREESSNLGHTKNDSSIFIVYYTFRNKLYSVGNVLKFNRKWTRVLFRRIAGIYGYSVGLLRPPRFSSMGYCVPLGYSTGNVTATYVHNKNIPS